MTVTQLRPAIWDLYPYRGDDLIITLRFPTAYTVHPTTGDVTITASRDVSGWNLEAQVRAYPNASGVLAEFDVDNTDEADGIVVIALTTVEMAILPARDLVWDCQRTAPNVKTLYTGVFGVGGDITRAAVS